MVDANANSSEHQSRPHGILKNAHEGVPIRHVMFDEEEIAAYDSTRGNCMPIDDPKTPFHEQESDEEMAQEAAALGDEAEFDPEVAQHLR